MALIRDCQPSSFDEWQYGISKMLIPQEKIRRKSQSKVSMNWVNGCMQKLRKSWFRNGKQLFVNWQNRTAFDYIYNLTINRTYDGYIREKSVINDGLVKVFPNINFEESDPELDHAGDIDYIAKIGDKAIGIQIKPITASANFGSYSLTERMKVSFESFKERYGGNVFIVSA